ncbi:MAG: hypothetical protein LQ338_002404 [Usnochroma carphineum]|nr:MAG: hypothetical protein LQ338_002404 [Usnochroma carphineum]
MNNSQFRRLVNDTPSTTRRSDGGSTGGLSGHRSSATPTALGSRMRSSIPMTPRSLGSSAGVDFARQVAERDAALNPALAKKFRSSAAPKGTKLGAGYQDRTQLRTSAEEDEKASRIKALEEMVKLGQMERATFEALRDEITGGDVKNVHLVKGLDRKLLERVRKGEDVLAEAAASPSAAATKEEASSADPSVDVDEEFERLEGSDVQPMAKQETVKKGEMAPPPPSMTGKKRTRDDILKELKASRQAAAEKAELARQPVLGTKFHKIGEKKATSRIEIDARGREVLITVDADGNVKRKVKKAKPEVTPETNGLLMPDKDAKPLGLDVTVPVTQPMAEEKDDGDIFAGIGADYDPLGGEADNDDISEDSEDESKSPLKANAAPTKTAETATTEAPTTDTNPLRLPKEPSAPKNYFNETDPTPPEAPTANSIPFQDPTILAALKKASTLDPLSSSKDSSTAEDEASKAARRRKQLLEAHDRDADDLDMGFGSSRFEDKEDGEGKRVKLSAWGSSGAGEDDGGGEGKGKRKRGPKKRKGDKDSAADVMKVLERRRGGK